MSHIKRKTPIVVHIKLHWREISVYPIEALVFTCTGKAPTAQPVIFALFLLGCGNLNMAFWYIQIKGLAFWGLFSLPSKWKTLQYFFLLEFPSCSSITLLDKNSSKDIENVRCVYVLPMHLSFDKELRLPFARRKHIFIENWVSLSTLRSHQGVGEREKTPIDFYCTKASRWCNSKYIFEKFHSSRFHTSFIWIEYSSGNNTNTKQYHDSEIVKFCKFQVLCIQCSCTSTYTSIDV